MRTRKLFVLAFSLLVLIALGGGVLVWGLPTLRATLETDTRPRSTLLIARHSPQILFSTVEVGGSSGDSIENYQWYLKTQCVMIKGRLLLSTALADRRASQLLSIKNRSDPITWLQQNLEVTNPKDTELLQVSLASSSGASTSDQAVIINAIVHAYIDEVVNGEFNRRAAKARSSHEGQAEACESAARAPGESAAI